MDETTSLPSRIETKELVYRDRNHQVHRTIAQFDGFIKEYYIADYGRRAAAVVVDGDKVLFARQYRVLIDGISYEIPGGRVDDDETPEAAAIRECEEETGIQCFNLKNLVSYQAGLDILNNPTFVFYSEEFNVCRDDAERSIWIPWVQCVEMIFSGQILDGLSIIALLAYRTGLHNRTCQI